MPLITLSQPKLNNNYYTLLLEMENYNIHTVSHYDHGVMKYMFAK